MAQFNTLDQALRTLVEMPVHHRPYYADFHHVCVRETAATVALLKLSKHEETRKGGVLLPTITNFGAMEHFASAATQLFLNKALLPALLIELCKSRSLIEALGESNRELRVKAATVGGTFETEVLTLCNLMKGYCDATPVQRAHRLMANWIQKIITCLYRGLILPS